MPSYSAIRYHIHIGAVCAPNICSATLFVYFCFFLLFSATATNSNLLLNVQFSDKNDYAFAFGTTTLLTCHVCVSPVELRLRRKQQ